MFYAKWLDSWRQIYTPYTNVTGTWRRIKAAWTKVDGVWRQFYNECPTYFSVPNIGSQSGGRIHSQTGGYYMHNRDLVIPKQYVGYKLIGMSGTMYGSQSWNEGTGGGWREMTLALRLMDKTSGANATWVQTWPSQGSVIGTSGGENIVYYYSVGNSIYWYRERVTDDWETYYYKTNYHVYSMNKTFSPITITGNLNLYYYIDSIDDDNNAAGYWQNLKLTLQNPHTGNTVALSFA